MIVPVERAELILASASPRRIELLGLLGVPFAVISPEADESAEGDGPHRVVEIARRKGADVFARYPGKIVLSADTLVCLRDTILGKPTGAADAKRMLRLLSGKWHEVYTGVCLHIPGGGMLNDVSCTRVKFTELSDELISRYVATGEPLDKAGAYAMQGVSGVFVERIEGSPSNVIGLPMDVAYSMLRGAGINAITDRTDVL